MAETLGLATQINTAPLDAGTPAAVETFHTGVREQHGSFVRALIDAEFTPTPTNPFALEGPVATTLDTLAEGALGTREAIGSAIERVTTPDDKVGKRITGRHLGGALALLATASFMGGPAAGAAETSTPVPGEATDAKAAAIAVAHEREISLIKKSPLELLGSTGGPGAMHRHKPGISIDVEPVVTANGDKHWQYTWHLGKRYKLYTKDGSTGLIAHYGQDPSQFPEPTKRLGKRVGRYIDPAIMGTDDVAMSGLLVLAEPVRTSSAAKRK